MPVRPEGFKPPVQAKSKAYDKNSSDEDYVQEEGVLTKEQNEEVNKLEMKLKKANNSMLKDFFYLQQKELEVNLLFKYTDISVK